MPASRPASIVTAVLSALLLILIVSTFPYIGDARTRNLTTKIFQTYSSKLSSSDLQKVANTTLGFEKVFVVGLPERTDKRDALALTSTLTGFKLDWIDGIKGETIPDKALPFGVDRDKLWNNNLGSWRGHMNAIRSIVEDGYASALILEDDMDWDVRLKSQLQLFARGSRYVQTAPMASTRPIPKKYKSPYGTDWDVLWLGHCGEVFPEDLPESLPQSSARKDEVDIRKRRFAIYPDVTLPPPERMSGYQNFSEHPHTRWVHITGGPICTFAYALSAAGAKKVLYDLSVDHLLGAFDNALANLCRYAKSAPEDGGLNMRCISVTPPLFFHHRPKGNIRGDSDIQKVGNDPAEDAGQREKQEIRTHGYTENIAWSARTNAKNVMLGLKSKDQYQL